MKIRRSELRRIILKEIQASMEEERLMQRDDYPGYGMLHRHDDPGRQAMYRSCSECGYKMSMYEGDKGVCEQCGSSMMKEGKGKSGMCEQCGTKSMVYEGEKGVCEQCGYSTMEAQMEKEYGSINEGDCGCGPSHDEDTSDDYESGDYEVLDYDSDDDFIPDHMQGQGAHDFDEIQQALFDRFPHIENINVEFDHDNDVKIGNHKHYKGSYMAKSHLYKVNKYAEKLYQMIPDGHNLEDWMRTKLAQIADDIGEVYHALDHDLFEGDV